MSIALWLEHYLVVVMAVLFVGIVATTFWPGRKAAIEQQGRIPFEDDV
ncbi:MAG TPA: cbb3-type cytochrome c oxidase subunit 3 [Rhodopila sp.]|jgi:cbb3-type cytochrome oxidase subunit 3|nr:cbb3-type cytochrome c oxidase subunit 3 [Rhodopila sp.]